MRISANKTIPKLNIHKYKFKIQNQYTLNHDHKIY